MPTTSNLKPQVGDTRWVVEWSIKLEGPQWEAFDGPGVKVTRFRWKYRFCAIKAEAERIAREVSTLVSIGVSRIFPEDFVATTDDQHGEWRATADAEYYEGE